MTFERRTGKEERRKKELVIVARGGRHGEGGVSEQGAY